MDPRLVQVLLRFVHVMAGVIWVGAGFMLAAYVIPSARASGPGGGAVIRQITQVRKLPSLLNWVMYLTLISGVVLYWRLSGGFTPAFFRTGMGIVFGVGGLLGIAAGVLGATLNGPTAAKIGALGAEIAKAGGAPTPEQAARNAQLQDRMLLASRLNASLLLAATLAMAVARYV